jgi:hypothetical protein
VFTAIVRALISLMMETVQTSETLVNSYQSTRRYNPEDSHLHSHRHGNLKSNINMLRIWQRRDNHSSKCLYVCQKKLTVLTHTLPILPNRLP